MTDKDKGRPLFVEVLEALVEWDGSHMGGDVEEDLARVEKESFKRRFRRDRTSAAGEAAELAWTSAVARFCYDLRLMEALPPPADGEVVVYGDRAKQLLALVEQWGEDTVGGRR